jgi:hypothetical protein
MPNLLQSPPFKPRLRLGMRRALAAVSALICGCALAAADQTVLFYNPETSIDNFATLKTEFDTYLAEHGGYSFQPFSDRANFEQALRSQPNSVYLLSSWHYSQLNSQFPLEPVLVGTAKGEYLQRKVLSARDAADPAGLQGTTVAGAGTEEYLRNLLKQMFGPDKESLVAGLKVLTVPKDIDALMAVGFGMAKAALASEGSLQKLALINAKQREQLKPLASSDKSFLLIAAVPKSSKAEGETLVKVMEDMGQQPAGARNLRLLGLDGWKRLDSLDPSLSKLLR